jgi:hypothetical protein
MAYTSSQLDSVAERNRVNDALRASDQWRSAIRAMGLNPDGPLQLTKAQQTQLGQQLGLPLSDFHIDPAGNINDYHGWKGLPTWAKTAAIAGAAVGTAGLGGMFSGAPGAFGLGGGAAAAAPAAEIAGIDAAIGGMGAGGWAPAAAGGGFLGGLRKVGEVLAGGKKLTDQASGDGKFDWTKLIPLGLGAASAIRGATRGPTASEQALQTMLGSAQARVDAQEPIFRALTTMAHSQLPDYTKKG